MAIFLFEFMDHPRTPRILRETLLDVLDYCNRDFRPYYHEIAQEIVKVAQQRGLTTIVELGAGYAPLTRALAESNDDNLTLIPCDLYPEKGTWQRLESRFGTCVQPVYEPVDFTIHREWPSGTGVVLCAALHHIQQDRRPETLRALHDSADCILIFEPIRKTPFSMFLVLFSLIPALLTPVFRLNRPGNLRRILFCWLVPIVPAMFVWDGLVSCLRQWSHSEWDKFVIGLPPGSRQQEVISEPHSQTVIW